MTNRKEEAFALAQRLLNVGIDLVGAADLKLDEQWTRHPNIIGLSLLCRSLTNFRGALLLLNDRHPHVVEARVLARCLYENLLWIGTLQKRGSTFVKEMLADDAANRAALGELALKLSSKHGKSPSDETSLLLRRLVKESRERVEHPRKLRANEVAEQSVIELAYSEYTRLALEAVHCSITALGRHLTRERVADGYALTIVVSPEAQEKQIVDTIIILCRATVGIVVAANEMLGFTRESARVKQIDDEFALFQSDAL